MSLIIRPMKESDISDFYEGFLAQGWDKPRSLFEKYLREQAEGTRKIFVAEADGAAVGYTTLLPCDPHGPFSGEEIPAIVDFNVLASQQGKGTGTAILDAVEAHVREYSSRICLGVGLHPGYGPAQRLYIKRGYVPDGGGIWYQDELLPQNAPCKNDDELVLYMSKQLR